MRFFFWLVLFSVSFLRAGDSLLLFDLYRFRGASCEVNEHVPDFSKLSLAENEIKSIAVPAGATVIIYEGRNYKGDALLLRRSVESFSLSIFHLDGVGSIRFFSHKDFPDGVLAFDRQDFNGNYEWFRIDDDNLSNNQIGNDRIRSLLPADGWSAILYEDHRYEGREEWFKTGDADLRDNLLGLDRASSIRVLPPGIRPGDLATGVELFEHEDFRGRSKVIYRSDEDLTDEVIGFPRASSIRVPENTRVILYEEADFKGRSQVFTDSAPRLSGEDNGVTKVKSISIHR